MLVVFKKQIKPTQLSVAFSCLKTMKALTLGSLKTNSKTVWKSTRMHSMEFIESIDCMDSMKSMDYMESLDMESMESIDCFDLQTEQT